MSLDVADSVAHAGDDRSYLRHEVERAGHALAGQGPISTFIHHNTLHGFEHLPFEEAAFEAERVIGGRCFLPPETNRAHHAKGRITDADLDAAISARKDLTPNEILATVGNREVRAGEVYRAHLIRGVYPTDPGRLRFDARELGALKRLRADVSRESRERILERTAAEEGAALARVGHDLTLSGWLADRTGLDAPAFLRRGIEQSGVIEHPPDAERNLKKLGIPPDRWQDYLACVDREMEGVALEGVGRDGLRRLWLRDEVRVVKKLARRHFGVRGTLPALAARSERDREAVAVGGLWRASLGAYGLEDPLSPTDPTHLLGERDADGGAAESEWRRFAPLDLWGGPSVPLDGRTRAELTTAVERRREGSSTAGRDAATPRLSEVALAALKERELHRGGYEALHALFPAGDPDRPGALDVLQKRDPRRKMLAAVGERTREELGRLGRDRTHADVLRDLTGEDITREVNERMIRLCGAFLDEGQAAWRMPERNLGFYDSWKRMAPTDRAMDLRGAGGWRDGLQNLPEKAEDAVISFLKRLGVERAHWGEYVRRIILALPGWAGLISWREARPGYPRQQAQPVDLVQYVAVRLFHETLLVEELCKDLWGAGADADGLRRRFAAGPHEFLVRRGLFGDGLPEFLAAEARGVVDELSGNGEDERWRPMAERIRQQQESSAGPTAHDAAWRLFGLAQLLGLSGGEVDGFSSEERDRIMGALDSFPEKSHGPVWLAAFERHYADEILNAVAANRGRGRWITREERPRAQVIFCIDEREEAFRRHLEEIDPGLETFGTAGFFGIAMNFEGLDDHDFIPLCPQPAMAQNAVVELVRKGDEGKRERQKDLVGWEGVFHNSYWETKRNSVSAYFLYDLIAPLVAVPLFGKILSPRRYTNASLGVKNNLTPEVRTRLTLIAEEEGHGLGFTLGQQADKIEAALRNIGLISGFAPIVLFSGHGSASANNPHESAHDCGACGGKHGGPNARAFAAMANRKEVREVLRDRGINIPEDTHFAGSQHNTCNERMTYLDVEDVPESHRERFRELMADMDEARARSAQERCRRFGSAPKDASPKKSLAHVEARSVDLSQVRPEWGHATNACAFFGRRSMTQGLFLDRRGFLVSYDPTIDPDGTILERILLAAGPVGAGISLEYYFSTVDNETFGCDTKLPHNVAGLLGVMEGTTSDLRTGLPLQMVEVHEPMRLLLVVDAAPETLGMIYGRQPAIQTLVGKEWVHLASVHPDTGDIQVFVPDKGFVPWDGRRKELQEVNESFDWYRGQTDFLPPARITANGGAPRG